MVATIGCRPPKDDDEAVDRAAKRADREHGDDAEPGARAASR